MEKIPLPEGLLNEEVILSLEEFSIVCRVEEPLIIEMVEIGILEPQGREGISWEFSLTQMFRVKRARRLQNDLKLNLSGVALVLDLLDEINNMRDYINTLEYQVKSQSR